MPKPDNIEFINPYTLLIVSSIGNIKQLYTPIRAKCTNPVGQLLLGSTVYIEAIGTHPECRICYQICQLWYPYNCFELVHK